MFDDCGFHGSFDLFQDHVDQLNHQVDMDAPDWIPAGSVVTLDYDREFDEIGATKQSFISR